MELLESDIKTKEVLDWQGVHLLHFQHSSCSQKARIFLNLKGIEWQSHHLNLAKQVNYDDWFLGINPRGLVPVLVHDGKVHIESNDILTYLDRQFPEPPLIPNSLSAEIAAGLKQEDDLHLDIRAITMGYLSPKSVVMKKTERLKNYEANPGTVLGEADPHKLREIQFWQAFAKSGVTESQAFRAAQRFFNVYIEHDRALESQHYLLGDRVTLLDIAWFIYTHRLTMAGYPFAELHPSVKRWYDGLMKRSAFAKEVKSPVVMSLAVAAFQGVQRLQGKTLRAVMQKNGLL